MSNLKETLHDNFGGLTTEVTPSMENLVTASTPYTQEAELGNEGFTDVISNIAGDIKRNLTVGRKKSIKVKWWGVNYRKNINIIDLYYTNENWLSKRRFIEGDVKAKGIAEYFVRGVRGHVDMSDAVIDEMITYIEKYVELYIKDAKAYMEKAKPIVDRIRKGPLTPELYAEAFYFFKEDDVTKTHYMRSDLKFPFGNVYFSDGGLHHPDVFAPSKIPALSMEGVISHAEKVKRLLAYIHDLWERIDRIVDASKMFSFVDDHTWRGWSEIDRMQNGALGIGAHLGEMSRRSDNLLDKMLLSAGQKAFTEQEQAEAWDELLVMYLSESARPSAYYFSEILTRVSNALALHIDRSIR